MRSSCRRFQHLGKFLMPCCIHSRSEHHPTAAADRTFLLETLLPSPKLWKTVSHDPVCAQPADRKRVTADIKCVTAQTGNTSSTCSRLFWACSGGTNTYVPWWYLCTLVIPCFHNNQSPFLTSDWLNEFTISRTPKNIVFSWLHIVQWR